MMLLAAGRRRLHIKAVYQSVREATTASGVDNTASPRLANFTAERDYFTLREADHYAKTTGTDILMSSADEVAHRWAAHTINEQYARASSGV